MATSEDSLAVSYETGRAPAWDPGALLLGIYPRELRTRPHRTLHLLSLYPIPKPGGTQDVLQWVTDKRTMGHPDNGMLFGAEKK